jgi:hypothetical protein
MNSKKRGLLGRASVRLGSLFSRNSPTKSEHESVPQADTDGGENDNSLELTSEEQIQLFPEEVTVQVMRADDVPMQVLRSAGKQRPREEVKDASPYEAIAPDTNDATSSSSADDEVSECDLRRTLVASHAAKYENIGTESSVESDEHKDEDRDSESDTENESDETPDSEDFISDNESSDDEMRL